MAHKKGLGSSRNGRDSRAQRLGVKMFAGQAVKTGCGCFLPIRRCMKEGSGYFGSTV